MPRQRFDISSKWLLHNQGKGALLVGGLKGVRRYQAMPGEIAQPRKYPDGLLQVFLARDKRPHHVLIEVATYPEKRALKQALDDMTLAYAALGQLPELLILILRPRGQFRIGVQHGVRSRPGLSRLEAGWRAVELWTLSAEEFLAEGDVGVVPWVPLMEFNGPPEALLERCAAKIDAEAHAKDRADLFAVSQVIGGLRFAEPELLSLLGGQQAMIESPVLQKLIAERFHSVILDVLKDRFGSIPRDVTRHLGAILDEKRLRKLILLAGKCPDLQAFRDVLFA
jgi:hypothetical protein